MQVAPFRPHNKQPFQVAIPDSALVTMGTLIAQALAIDRRVNRFEVTQNLPVEFACPFADASRFRFGGERLMG